MKIKFTYKRPQGEPVDLIATIDSATTVGDLAEHLRVSDPQHQGDDTRIGTRAATLTVIGDQGNVVLDPELLVSDSALTSGSHVSLVAGADMFGGAGGGAAAARVRVLSGPDVGREYSLPMGSSIIGRDTGCDIVLSDPMVSRRHARINVTDVVEVIDLGSANGLVVGTATLPRTTLRPSDVVTMGDTELTILLLRIGSAAPTVATQFNRSPRVAPIYGGREYQAPEAPERTKPQRFPTIALVVPVIMGAVLYLVTGSALSLIFIALSPVMMVGNAVESRIASKRDFKKAVADFESDLEGLRRDMADELVVEARRRREEFPLGTACLEAVSQTSPLLWSRRPDIPAFSDVAFGLGQLPSRSSVAYPKTTRAPHEIKARAVEALSPLGVVPNVPVVAAFSQGAVGVAGPRSLRMGPARSLMLQVAALRSPAEMVVCGFFATDSAPHWDWLKWLPHTTSPHSPIAGHHVPATQQQQLALLTELENLLGERAEEDAATLPAIVVLVESDAAEAERARLVSLAEAGASVGIHLLWLAPEVSQLPAACKTFAKVAAGDVPGSAGFVRSGMEVLPVAFDDVTAADALDAALRLTHVVDAGALIADDSDLPRSVSQLSLFPTDPLTEIGTIIERWQQSQSILTGPFAPSEPIRKAGNLRALVGQSPIGPHYLDLRADGPHALVGGMTGSGKSEFLQSWILALAATHSPQRLNFLLVDYKGGAAFADCDRLPHSTGLVTDLSPHMVRRALTSLSAELKFREEFLRDHDAKDLQALEAQGHEDAPPSLVVVIDEFAKLKEDVPEFFEGMIDVAQRGRSLGVHLIMATQRPAGVITGSLRANTNLRLALRLADEADSTDILGTPVAATFDADTPGRAVSKSGPGRLVPFQAAYAGGWTTDERDAPEILVQELTLLAPATWESPAGEPVVRDKNATDIKRLVQTIIDADAMAALPEPKRAWQPVLAPTSSLEHLHLGGSDSSLAIGQADDPEHQDRPVVHFVPDRDGSMVVYGTGGAGKSTFLRSIAVASGLTTHDGPCHVYGLDFGSRGLSMLEVLPHVGSVINGSDHERVIRLLGWLRTEVEERARRYSPYNVGSITQYRVQSKNADEPRIILLLDGIAAFRAAYDSTDRIRWVDALGTIASEGRPVGVHVVMSSETRSGLTTALASSVQRRLVLRLAAEEEYGMLGVESDVLSAKSPPGRGLLDGLEVQVAVLGGSADPVLQAAEVENLARAMREANRSEAPPIRRLPELVAFDTLPIPLEGIPVGIASDDLDVFSVSPRGAFLLSGSAGSGRSTALEVLAASFRRSHPCGELHYLGLRRSAAAQAPWWTSVAFGVDEIQQRALELAKRLDAGEGPRVAVFLEAAGDQVSGPAEQALQQLVRACTTEEHWFVAEGEMSTLINQSGFLGQVKAARSGLILQPDPDSGQTLLRTPYPRVNRSDFPPGRGIYISRGHVRIVQVAMPDLIAVGPDG